MPQAMGYVTWQSRRCKQSILPGNARALWYSTYSETNRTHSPLGWYLQCIPYRQKDQPNGFSLGIFPKLPDSFVCSVQLSSVLLFYSFLVNEPISGWGNPTRWLRFQSATLWELFRQIFVTSPYCGQMATHMLGKTILLMKMLTIYR